MEEEIAQKWHKIIDMLKDGKSIKVTRCTAVKGKTAPFGTLSRRENKITFRPTKGVRANAFTTSVEKAVERLTDAELLLAFSF